MTTALLPLMSESTLRDMAIVCVSKADQTAYDFAREAYIDARDTSDPGDVLSVNDEEFEGVLATPAATSSTRSFSMAGYLKPAAQAR